MLSIVIRGGVVQFWLERRPVTPEVASSSLVVPAINDKVSGNIDFVLPFKIKLLTVYTVKSFVISAIAQSFLTFHKKYQLAWIFHRPIAKGYAFKGWESGLQSGHT